jgi:hypothetical protein
VSIQLSAVSPTRRRLGRLAVTFALLVSALVGAIAPAGVANADVRLVYCEEHRLPDGRLIVPCWPLDNVWINLRPDPDPCLSCLFAIQFRWFGDPDPEPNLVAAGILAGIRGLAAASQATNPNEREALRAGAHAAYTDAAAHLGKVQLAVGRTWKYYGDPSPQPNLPLFQKYGNEVITGLNLLRAAAANPQNAAQYRAQAIAAFDRGAANFAAAAKTY